MAWFRRKKKAAEPDDRQRRRHDLTRLEEFHATRTGVEAFIEPATTVTETTVMLIAHDGEWTRKRVDSVESAFRFGARLSMPVYEVAKVGYPQRKRDYDARRRIERKRAAGG